MAEATLPTLIESLLLLKLAPTKPEARPWFSQRLKNPDPLVDDDWVLLVVWPLLAVVVVPVVLVVVVPEELPVVVLPV